MRNLQKIKSYEKGWFYESYSYVTTLKLFRFVIFYTPQLLGNKSTLKFILNFIQNETPYKLKSNEKLEQILTKYYLSKYLKLQFIQIPTEINLSNCKQNCSINLNIKRSINYENSFENNSFNSECKYIVKNNENKSLEILKVDQNGLKIVFKKKELENQNNLNIQIECKSGKALSYFYYENTLQEMGKINIINVPEISFIQIQAVKQKEIPKLEENTFLRCNDIKIKATQFDVVYLVLDLKNLSFEKSTKNTIFISLRLKKFYNKFLNKSHKGKNSKKIRKVNQ